MKDVRQYSGFSFFYTLARQGKLTATSTIFKYINRDEVTHLVLFQNIIRELRRERPDLFTPELEAKITDMIRQGAENEIAWPNTNLFKTFSSFIYIIYLVTSYTPQ